ncbi:MAG TPA: 1-phosphofructokinase [Epulopiscium sp.]|nr:1-phosphofructokinase [Candidatus Epulonipiscium sp.]
MITTVTLNPTIDRTIILNSFHHGSINRITSVKEDAGGKGINVAKVLQSLGHKSCAIGFLGKNNSDYVESLLEAEKLTNDFITVEGQTRFNTKIVEMDTKITTDIKEIGFEISEEKLSSLKDLIITYAKKSEVMTFNGSVPPGLPSNVYFNLLSIANEYTKTVLDTDGVFLLEGLKASPYIIKPNIDELESAISRKLNTHEEIKVAARELIRDYHIKYVLVSMGANGSILISAHKAIFAKSLKVDVKSSVGAGDAMTAGFIYGVMNEDVTTSKALAYATACGALAARQGGTQAFKKEDVIKLVKEVELVSF